MKSSLGPVHARTLLRRRVAVFTWVIVVLAISPAVSAPTHFSVSTADGSPVGFPAVAQPQGATGDQSERLQFVSPNAAAGAAISFDLNISPAYCGNGPEYWTVSSVRFSMGDGFQFSVPGVPGESSCANSALGYESMDFGYAFASPGTYRASALVSYDSGLTIASNLLFVNITIAPAPDTTQLQYVLYGSGGSALLVMAVLLVVRRRMPPAPSLPPNEV